jgi:hypothetical protein
MFPVVRRHLPQGEPMSVTANPGRVAGFWYLLLVFVGPLRLIYIPNTLFVPHDTAATVANIAAHESLFRLGMVADLTGAVTLIFLTLAFYRLFEGVDRHLAVLVIILGGVMPSLIYFVNVVTDAATLMIVRGADFLSVFGKPQQDALAVLFLRLHGHQVTAAEVLWGAWLFPLGFLVYRSRFLPRFLGIWLVINGVAYVVLSLIGLLAPQYEDAAFLYGQPAFFAEIALMLWLVIRGGIPPGGGTLRSRSAALDPA